MSKGDKNSIYTCIKSSADGVEKDCERIQQQYNKRIEFVKSSSKTNIEKEEEIKQLKFNAATDPRRPNIFYDTEEYALKKSRIARRLDWLKESDFLISNYVLNWSSDKPDVCVFPYTGDITQLNVDAIVSAANGALLGGSGVNGAIHKAAGPELLKECKKIREKYYPDGLPAGNAVITKGYLLPAKYVIHTVGPIWEGGNHGEPDLLYKCYFNSLLLAKENKVEAIAFPEVSTGSYGYPKEKARPIALKAINDFAEKYPGGIEEILLVTYNEN